MPTHREESATVDIKIRMKEPLRADIERAAKRRGVSMNAEMVERLAQSFRDEGRLELFQEAYYGRPLAAVLSMLGRVMKDSGEHAAFTAERTLEAVRDWISNPYAFDQASKAACSVIEGLRPSGDPTPPTPKVAEVVGEPLVDTNELLLHFGQAVANGVLWAVADPGDGRAELEEWARDIREKLGSAADRIARNNPPPNKARSRKKAKGGDQ